MFDDLGADLFILQFGGNTVPYLDDEKDVADYGNWLESQMRNIKRMRPDADIILIGPADMSMKSGESFITYPLLPKVVEAMKKAAFDSGAAFWDMYSAMGGENSMSGWVEKKLAGDDYTHFYPDGAKYIIQMFYDALMDEYDEFSNQPDKL
jgi:lysophospholipase L1-like esterase